MKSIHCPPAGQAGSERQKFQSKLTYYYRQLHRLCENALLTNPGIYARELQVTNESGL